MAHYMVILNMQIGEYEKVSHNVVEADDTYEAWDLALHGECHNECRMEDNGGSCWDGDEMYYTVDDSHELTEKEYRIFKRVGVA